MATRRKTRTPTAAPSTEPPRWRALAHALASDLLALTLLLDLAGMATKEEERTRHLEAARRALTEGEHRLDALHQAVRLEDGELARQTLTEREGRLQTLRQAFRRLDERAPARKQSAGPTPRTPKKTEKNVRKVRRTGDR
ncbi:hypothetical protein [Archangium primigenium]|uniref:hypothetical protein n=1 Tax=[Archangium] primigenium TaxID=2792470 RepID=UPI00195D4099|nr:hypothetical protein [Archangium primigenium]MBM7116640.1 hypothetical protein [Archangium primigenium]